jgi:hypothetical protein
VLLTHGIITKGGYFGDEGIILRRWKWANEQALLDYRTVQVAKYSDSGRCTTV